MELCEICPRRCKVDRDIKNGYCGSNNRLAIAKVMLHHWEEPIISGVNGSGAIFFSGCSLKCIYCQNYKISSEGIGKEIGINDLIEVFKKLENLGAHNINLVSPTHYARQIVEALKIYKPKIPIIWNTSGYENVETIEFLKDYIDIYLTDFKYFNNELAKEFSYANNYVECCKKAILKMRENQPEDIIENGIMKKGLIIRHLVLPNCIEDSKNIFNYIIKELGNSTYISLMSQYVPCYKALNNKKLNRKLKPVEYKIVLNYIKKLNFKNGFLQDLSSSNECYTPNFEEHSEIKF